MDACRKFFVAILSSVSLFLLLLSPGATMTARAADPPKRVHKAPAAGQDEVGPHSRLETVAKDKKERLLAEPLVEGAARLRRLHPTDPVWIDQERTKVVLVRSVCGRKAPLELFACLADTKEYESVVAVRTKAQVVHAGLLAVGLDPGHPARFGEKYIPGSGPQVAVTVVWKDGDGRRRSAAAQQWVRNVRTGKAMEETWIFVGSRMARLENGRQRYEADVTGDLICVSNFPDATLDLPIRSTEKDASLLFEAFTEHIPPRGTPVTLILEAKHPKKKPGPKGAAPKKPRG